MVPQQLIILLLAGLLLAIIIVVDYLAMQNYLRFKIHMQRVQLVQNMAQVV